jgi:enoyl-[acyl-carrier protein] reductase I
MEQNNGNGGLMSGKRGIVFGVASDRSIAWGIAKAVHQAGGELAFTYQGDSLKKRVEPLVSSIGGMLLGDCDVADEGLLDAIFEKAGTIWETIDFVVHAVAYADKNELTGRYVDTSGPNFDKAMLISAYSLTAISRRAEPLMRPGASILTLSYYGSEKVMPNYNVMGVAKAALEASVRYLAMDLGKAGIRVNALSAGPIKTLAAAGIDDFR